MKLSLGMTSGLTQTQELSQHVSLDQRLELYETAGDIELISLHRIRKHLPSLRMESSVRALFVQELIAENAEYRAETQSSRYCLTANQVDSSITGLERELRDGYLAYAGLQDSSSIQAEVIQTLERMTGEVATVTRTWFSDNYDDLIYDTSGTIPWPVVCAMRGRFRQWAAGDGGAFGVPIGDFVEKVARTEGLDPTEYASYEDIWRELRQRERRT